MKLKLFRRKPKYEWFSAGTDNPGDQCWDGVPGTVDVSRWGCIGPEYPNRWSWSIQATNDAGDQWDESGGIVDTEADAKRKVESWRP